MADTKFYRAKDNTIVDQNGRQIVVVLASNCTKKLAREMAAYAAQQANHDAQRKTRAPLAPDGEKRKEGDRPDGVRACGNCGGTGKRLGDPCSCCSGTGQDKHDPWCVGDEQDGICNCGAAGAGGKSK